MENYDLHPDRAGEALHAQYENQVPAALREYQRIVRELLGPDDPAPFLDAGRPAEDEDPGPPWGSWPDLTGEYNVLEILAAIRLVDWHLDDAAPAIYKTNPLANMWRRIAAGPASEGQESVDALNLATGGNPRKGVVGGMDEVLGELGDTAVAALLGIQSITKDTGATWSVFVAALAKALSRVPLERPS